jgi:hypothetical protein
MFNVRTTTLAKRTRNVLAHLPGYQRRQRFDITLDLHQIGEQSPYFSATVSGRSFGGCNHELILRHWPQAKCIVDLHLCDMDGAPMHTEANALYHAQAYLHQQKAHYPAAKGLDYLASHLRISQDQALDLLADLVDKTPDVQALLMKAFCDQQRPRWQQEADQALAFLNA